ncbi:MAG TPA: hypothetical protein VFV67_01060 [Actinophytocola sp.]|uniref:hypothetical protein n=1 Tax=Actinophytocola sp. TaxID=1872138 RepID=UPI002DBC9AF1|nr:hypothetical protein [Actinophytocola sp.]HEU5469213.1 hypothetical protein [Actinophytocola sp.]
MATVDELWTWIYQPVQELLADRAGEAEKSWEELRASFVERAGLADPADHPLTDELVRQLDELPEDERAALLADAGRLEALVYELAERHAEAPAEDPDSSEPLTLSDVDIEALLAEDAEFADIPEERRRELIAQLLGS